MSAPSRILVKLSPGVALAAAEPRSNLRPLYDTQVASAGLGFVSAPTWYLADLDQDAANPWDLAHAQVARQLGINESAILFAEPDLAQKFVDSKEDPERAFAATETCDHPPQQDETHNKAKGPDFAWHLLDEFSQLGSARTMVQFSDPRTRIGHIDTGYDPTHVARPEHIRSDLERNFADGNGNPNSAQDPGRGRAIPDNSGHGTGTIGILAGGRVAQSNDYLGGSPNAEILPLRISNSVVLFHVSAFARALQYAIQHGCDVISISMGGLPSRAWSEAVNAAYEAGVCIAAAAGNNIGGLPSHHVVYPARYHRVVAVCGVMANGQPYYGIKPVDIQGSWGPDSCMSQAVASYTPNIPWAVFGCKTTLRLNGEGTSAATPQVAAAISLWFEKYKHFLPRDWRRVEAVRNALFQSAKKGNSQYLGNGILQAKEALEVAPVLNLPKTSPDNDSFPFLRVITGLGVAETPPREAMFNLELTQRYLSNPALQEIVPDPEKGVPDGALRDFMEAVVHDGDASQALRRHVASRYTLVTGGSIPGLPKEVILPPSTACSAKVSLPDPPFRRIRAYAVDPSLSSHLETASLNEVTLKVRWEKLKKGPIGEYIEVIDRDAVGTDYDPLDMDDPRLIAQDGYSPAEGNAAFHQQMVYAVAMKTIEHFERALGRPVLWRPESNPENQFDDSRFRRQLRIRPHALHQANAFYSPQEVALLFGYFEAAANDPADHVPGSMVYTCLSHDIIAHETTHAILDGMHRRFNEASNPDVLAFHEAFADIVALMQHFTLPEILANEISRTQGNLEAQSILGSLAVQFGRAIGGRGALRNAIGKFDEKGRWKRLEANPADYKNVTAPHTRGAILVAAVFDSFLAIYERRTANLLRIYTGGTGILPAGSIHPDLVHRLADEAVKSAHHILNMCIRALDYVPPVDITFGEFLRGLITADHDLVEDDRFNYRVAVVEAFRRRGIYPLDLPTLAVDTLRWQGVDIFTGAQQYPKVAGFLNRIVEQLKQYADSCFYIADRKELFQMTRRHRRTLHDLIEKIFTEGKEGAARELASVLGLDPAIKFEVHELRRSLRVGPDGQHIPQAIVALTQLKTIKVNSLTQTFRGGVTLVVDLSKPAVDYAIRKRIDSQSRLKQTCDFIDKSMSNPLQALLMRTDQQEPFAALHSLDSGL